VRVRHPAGAVHRPAREDYDVEVRIDNAGGEPVVAKARKPFIEPGAIPTSARRVARAGRLTPRD
jgi:hypothetical protein